MKQMTTAALAAMATGLAGQAFAQVGGPDGRYYGHMWGDGYGMGFGIFGAGMMILVWGIIIFFLVVAARWAMDYGRTGKSSTALDILKERLAKGEIDPAEYEARRKALEG
ncbi:MAG TPA: SHOCT domain-containing protein [Paracoccaceae bacterium]